MELPDSKAPTRDKGAKGFPQAADGGEVAENQGVAPISQPTSDGIRVPFTIAITGNYLEGVMCCEEASRSENGLLQGAHSFRFSLPRGGVV